MVARMPPESRCAWLRPARGEDGARGRSRVEQDKHFVCLGLMLATSSPQLLPTPCQPLLCARLIFASFLFRFQSRNGFSTIKYFSKIFHPQLPPPSTINTVILRFSSPENSLPLWVIDLMQSKTHYYKTYTRKDSILRLFKVIYISSLSITNHNSTFQPSNLLKCRAIYIQNDILFMIRSP